MKKTLPIVKFTLAIMKITFLQILIAGSFSGLSIGAGMDTFGQGILDNTVSIKAENRRFQDVLIDIEQSANVRFSFNPKSIPLKEKVSVEFKNTPLKKVLDDLSSQLHISYEVSGSYILLTSSQARSDIGVRAPREFVAVIASGTVSDNKSQPLPGVNIIEKGTTNGTTTDAQGKFSLQVQDESSVLIFSFIGYQSQEVTVGTRSSIEIVMSEDVATLSEIVVTGYGTQKKADLTGAVAAVDVEQMLSKPAADVSNMLQGRVAGVVASGSNLPGGEGYIRIRGISSFGSNEPLVIIDGVQTTGTNSINPNDIESMSILKDASSAAIYGARGAGGVIIISTKKGKADRTRITYDVFYGASQVSKYPELLNTAEYGDLFWKQQQGAGIVPKSSQYGSGANPVIPDYVLGGSTGGLFEGDPLVDPAKYNYDQAGYYQIVRASKTGTDWYKELTQTAPFKSHNIGLSGGTDKSVYSISLGYYDEAGLQKYTYYDRYSMRANSEFKITKGIRLGQTLFGSFRNFLGSDDNSEGSPWSQGYRMQPIIPVYDIAGNFAGSKAPGTGNGQNPVAMLYRAKDNSNKNIRILTSIYGEVDIIKDLTFRSSFGIDYNNYYNTAFRDINPEFSEGSFQTNLNVGSGYQYRWTFTNTLSYSKKIELHDFKALAGIEAIDYRLEQLAGSRVGYYPYTDESFRVLDRGNPIGQSNTSSVAEESLYSSFARLDYSYNDKYLLNATIRRDGSSKFAEDVRYGIFPSVSAGWRISQETFMKSIGSISDLKLRAGYGRVGNDQIDGSNQFSFYRSDPARSYYDIKGANTSTTQGYDLARKGNPESKWEETATINLGFDLSMFNNKLELNFDAYNKTTNDLLVQILRPGTEGDFSAPFINIGDTENKGIEATLTYRGDVIGKQLHFAFSSNFTAYKNKVTSQGIDFFTNQVRYGLVSRTVSEQPIGQFFGYQIQGFFDDVAEVMSAPTQAGVNKTSETTAKISVGRWRYKDINSDEKIDANDRVFLGSPHPKFQMGFSADFNYKNWDLNMFFFWNYGNQIYNNVKWWTDMNGSFTGNRSKTMLYNSWTPENPNAMLPKLDSNDNVTSSVPNSYYIESGSYFRAKTIQLGYTLPASALKFAGISKLRLYVQAQNLFTITPYTGPDPDLLNVGRGDIGLGVDHGRVPNPRQILGGLNLVF